MQVCNKYVVFTHTIAQFQFQFISTSIFHTFRIECLIFAILFAFSYFITQTSWLPGSVCPQKQQFCHHRMWHTFPPAHPHTPWIYRKNLSNHLTWRQFLGPGHLRFLLHVWPIKSGSGKGKCLSGTKVSERKCHVVYPIQ